VIAAGLEIDGLAVQFRGLKAIDNLRLAVRPGEFVSIVGPNGAGKSTLVQAITGFVRPSAGRVLFNGRRIDGLAPEAIAASGIARTFQTSRVFPALSVGESVLVGTQRALIGGGRHARRFGALTEPLAALAGFPAYRAAERAARARAEAVMRRFGDRLWPRREQPAHSLSYANRRRLDIARALVADPDLLLLDEPTAGMNPTESHELADMLLQLHVDFPAMAIVMIEHKLDVVRRLSRRAIVMGHGSAIVDDTPEAAFAHPEVAAAYLGRASTGARTLCAGPMTHAPAAAMPGDAATAAIELTKVDVFYGPVQALFGVSLRVGRGEAVAVLGGNASGKSTTVKTVLRLVLPKQGEVALFGRPMAARSTGEVIDAGIASIPEGRRMFAELTVRENLLMGAYARRRAGKAELAADMALALEEFPWLGSRLKQLAGTLSGGEQQMLALARAWLRRPQILCIDEPSMGLSPMMVERVYEILARWKAQGLTILMVEQSANHALALADRAYVLRGGAVVIEGAAADLRHDTAIREAYLGAAGTAKAALT
jgi:ABC-type branched-subunit amino acid transport system ATPase component